MITPFGLTIRKTRLDKGQINLKTMADHLRVSSAYLSAIEHGKRPISDEFVKKVYLYFGEQGITLQEWQRLAADSQPQMKLDLEANRETKLAFGRQFDQLPAEKKKMIRQILLDDDD